MNPLPRIAVGTVQPDADLQVMLWALISSTLERSGLHVQAFSSQSRFELRDASVPITGEGRRRTGRGEGTRRVTEEAPRRVRNNP